MAMYENSIGLDVEIERLTKKLSTLDPTSEEYKAVRISLDAFYKLRNEQYKVDTECNSKMEASEAEIEQKTKELEVRKKELDLAEKRLEAESKQREEDLETRKYELEVSEKQHLDDLKSQRQNRIRDYVLAGVNTAAGLLKLAAVIGFSIIVADQGYTFEEKGTVTSKTFKDGMKNAIDLVKDQFKKS